MRIDNTITNEALRYAGIGFSVIPIKSISKNDDGKKDIKYLISWKEYQNRIATKEEIESWNCDNLGIVTGRVSGLLVLDTDSYKENFDTDLLKSFNLPITPVQETASGGRQYFFKYPKDIHVQNDVCIGHKESGIDIRGEGGMVICPPSKTNYGEYSWSISPFDTPLADVPPKLLELLKGSSTNENKTRKTLPELSGLKEGEGRNNAMTSFIGKMLTKTNPNDWDSEVLPLAMEVNTTYKPPLDNDEFLRIYKSITKIEISKRNLKSDDKSFPLSTTHNELITKVFPPARYTLEPFFEHGTMNMVSAPPNNWKSWLLFLFAGHIANGTSVFNRFKTEKANVMIVNEEDSSRSIQDRLKLLDLTEPNLNIYYRVAYGSKVTDDFVNHLINEAKDKNIGVIMFDSLRAVHDSDENSSQEMQKIMDLFKRITRENITVVFTHHNRKKSPFARNSDEAESSRGSSAINASISGHISLEEVIKDDERCLVVKHLKSKVCEKLSPFELSINIDDKISFNYLGEYKPKEKVLNIAKERVLELLSTREEMLSRKDMVHLGVGGMTTVKGVLKLLLKEEKIDEVTRKRAVQSGCISLSEGKATEKLYSIKKEDEDLDVFTETLLNDT